KRLTQKCLKPLRRLPKNLNVAPTGKALNALQDLLKVFDNIWQVLNKNKMLNKASILLRYKSDIIKENGRDWSYFPKQHNFVKFNKPENVTTTIEDTKPSQALMWISIFQGFTYIKNMVQDIDANNEGHYE
uniref:Uncharacterized protein n=1 Tax=Glossina austeni TaxID=7395 RepID=A0A1A9VT49_GLOAU